MGTFLRILLMGLGLPAIAREIHEQGQKISNKLSVVTFLTENHRHIIKISIFAFVGSLLLTCGFTIGLMTISLHFDLPPEQSMKFSVILSLVILAAGLSFCAYAWKQALALEKEFATHQQHGEHNTSVVRNVLTNLVSAVVSNPMDIFNSKKTLN